MTGPTGVGKTRLSLKAAETLGAEIVNADSMQVYRFMDIGTAKATPEERGRVPHHLIDVVFPDEPYDAARFRREASEAVSGIFQRGKRVLVVGGTGLYIKALLHGLFPSPPSSPELRARLKAQALEEGSPALHSALNRMDPEAAARIHPNDLVRIVRAVEVFELTGSSITRAHKEHGFRNREWDVLYLVLNRPREELFHRIDRRTDEMLAAGLIQEVKRLLDMGYSADPGPMQAIGYRHAACYIRGELSLEETSRLLKRDTRRFAKRQLTWFGGVAEAKWLHPQEEESILQEMKAFFLSRHHDRRMVS